MAPTLRGALVLEAGLGNEQAVSDINRMLVHSCDVAAQTVPPAAPWGSDNLFDASQLLHAGFPVPSGTGRTVDSEPERMTETSCQKAAGAAPEPQCSDPAAGADIALSEGHLGGGGALFEREPESPVTCITCFLCGDPDTSGECKVCASHASQIRVCQDCFEMKNDVVWCKKCSWYERDGSPRLSATLEAYHHPALENWGQPVAVVVGSQPHLCQITSGLPDHSLVYWPPSSLAHKSAGIQTVTQKAPPPWRDEMGPNFIGPRTPPGVTGYLWNVAGLPPVQAPPTSPASPGLAAAFDGVTLMREPDTCFACHRTGLVTALAAFIGGCHGEDGQQGGARRRSASWSVGARLGYVTRRPRCAQWRMRTDARSAGARYQSVRP